MRRRGPHAPMRGPWEGPPTGCVRSRTRAHISFCLELLPLHLSVWDSRPSLFFLTLTTCFKSNLSPKPLSHLKISKSPHNLFGRPGGWAACNFLDSHHPSPPSTELFSAEQLLVFSRLWICSSQQMVFHGHSPQKAVWTSHAETKCGQHYRFA